MRTVDVVAERMLSLIIEQTQNPLVIDITREVVKILIKTRVQDYSRIATSDLDVVATSKEELFCRMLAIKQFGKRDVRVGYTEEELDLYSEELQAIDTAIDEFEKIVTVIYENK